MMLSGAGMAETEIAAEIKTYKNSNCRKSPGIYRDFSAFVTVLTLSLIHISEPTRPY